MASDLTEKSELIQTKEKEIKLLQDLQSTLGKAKHELNNDLTRLAIKNLPILQDPGQSTTHQTMPPETTANIPVDQQLEPLDLDLDINTS